MNDGRVGVAKQWANQFLTQRTLRYSLLNDVVIRNGDTNISCEEAEATMEMAEGIPDFVADRTLRNIVPRGELDIMGSISTPFYQFGKLQLLIMERDSSITMNDVISNILNSKNVKESIPQVFKDR